MEGHPGEERRREPRVEVSIGACLTIGGRTYLGRIRDLSPVGAYLELLDADPFPHDGRGALAATALGNEPIEIAVRSKRLDEDGLVRGLGIELVGTPERVRELVEREACRGGRG